VTNLGNTRTQRIIVGTIAKVGTTARVGVTVKAKIIRKIGKARETK
jgi:hypothetical protein